MRKHEEAGRVLTDAELYERDIEVPENAHLLTQEQINATMARLQRAGREALRADAAHAVHNTEQ